MIKKLQLKLWIVSITIFILIVALAPAIAQDQIQTITFEDMVMGELNLSRIQSSYVFDGNAGDTIYLRAQSLTPDFALRYTLLDADGQVLAEGTNTNGQPGSLSIIELPATDQFTVQVNSANNAGGQFSVSLENGQAQEMTMLPDSEIIYGNLDIMETEDYMFETEVDTTSFLMFETPASDSAMTITIEDVDTGETVAMFRSDVSGACMRMTSTESTYRISITSTMNEATHDYQVMLWESDITDLTCPSNIYAPEVDSDVMDADQLINTDTNVAVAPAGTQGINMRAAPTTNSPVISILKPDEDTTVIGTTEDGGWLMADIDGTVVFVNSDVVEIVLGDVDALPVVDASNLLNTYNLVDVNGNYGATDVHVNIGDTTNDDGFIDVDLDLDQQAASVQVDETQLIVINGENLMSNDNPVQNVVTNVVDNVTNNNNSNNSNNIVDDVTDTVDDAIDDVEDTVDNVVDGLLGGD